MVQFAAEPQILHQQGGQALVKIPLFRPDEPLFPGGSPRGEISLFLAYNKSGDGKPTGGLRWRDRCMSEGAEVTDVRDLARGMLFKTVLNGTFLDADKRLRQTGFKCLIFTPDTPRDDFSAEERVAIMRRIGVAARSFFVDEFAAYIGVDSGTSPTDLAAIQLAAGEIASDGTGRVVLGLPEVAGDPSPTTARLSFAAAKAAMRHHFGGGENPFSGRDVALKGIGHTGRPLAEMFLQAGVNQLFVGDTDEAKVEALRAEFRGQVVAVDPDEIYFKPADILVPAALSRDFDRDVLEAIIQARRGRPGIILGPANAQMAPEDELSLAAMAAGHNLHILPEYACNGGGVIYLALELIEQGEWQDKIDRWTANAETGMEEILARSEAKGITPHAFCHELVQSHLERAAA